MDRLVQDPSAGEWWFAIVDVIQLLSESPEPRKYWFRMKSKDVSLSELSPNRRQLKMKSSNNKFYKTDCANIQGLLRITQSAHIENPILDTLLTFILYFWLFVCARDVMQFLARIMSR